jgi:hypothetical protein
MNKIPYVISYELFEKIDLKAAEELLHEYNDFMVFNKTQVRDLGVPISCEFGPEKEETQEDALKRIEHNKQVAMNHFENLFGSKDIAESSLVGLHIDYDAVQKILLDERANKIPITESAFNQIAPTIRATASVLLIAERVIGELQKLASEGKGGGKIDLAIEFAKEGFELLLDGIGKGNLNIPEYHIIRRDINKLKNVDAYIEFCEKLFFAKGEIK